MSAQTGTIETQIPGRLDRLPWSRFHWLVVIGLGTVWILDGLEVTIVGSVADRMTESGSGIELNASQIGIAAAIYVAGSCLGALVFGQLTDRLGRKRLFLLTLAIYIVATVATAFAWTAWYFYLCRFVTGAGIGGEYAAINSAIDELIPARVRGRVDLMINGSYWIGAMAGSAAALVLLSSLFPANIGWRLSFGLGALLGLAIMFVRRNVPESPRWLFIHGREQEADQIVGDIEREVADETGRQLEEPDGDPLVVHQREVIPFREIARTAFQRYPRRAVLGLALFIGQAFLYNGITFNLGTLFSRFYGVSSSYVPVFVIVFAASNFLGPLLLGRFFDTVGRKPMIAGSYLGSAAVATVMAILFANDRLGSAWGLELFIVLTFFLASAGASAAYLTVSEVFPMETRALAIAFFYAVGTAIGGITGPLLFGHLVDSGSRGQVAVGFLVAAAVMALGGLAEVFLGVPAEQAALEDIATPLTVEEADDAETAPGADARRPAPDDGGAAAARRVALEAQRRVIERDRRVREGVARRRARERAGLRRYRPGPRVSLYAPRMAGLADPADADAALLDREIDAIGVALEERGPLGREALRSAVGARYWGPGRFSRALREAVHDGRAVRVSRATFGPSRSVAGGGRQRADDARR